MRKIIVTEAQMKYVLDTLISEQNWSNQKSVAEQIKTIKPQSNGKYCFTKSIYQQIKNDNDIKLHLVQPNETIETIVKQYHGNSIENVMSLNNLLKNSPQNLRAGDVIAISLAPAGGNTAD